MAHDFAKTRRRAAPEQPRHKPAAPPQHGKSMLVTGLLTGLVVGFFSFFLIYLSGILPPIGNMSAEAIATNAAELAAAQQRRNEELEEAATRLQLEFYKELPNYELIVDNMPQATAATVIAATGAQAVPAPVVEVSAALAAEPAVTVTAPDSAAQVAPQPQLIAQVAPAEVSAIAGAERESGFLLQAGAFQQESSAVAQSDRLLGLGLFSRVRQEALLGKTLFLVQVGPFDTREQVAQAEGILRSNGIDSIRMGLSQ